jgi:hypothetical protein
LAHHNNIASKDAVVRAERYNGAVAERRRDEFPNNFAGDLVKTERGWVVVPPTR